MMLSDAQDVLDSLSEEEGLCRELSALRLEQRRLIDAGEAEALLEVLARKQKAIDRIGCIEQDLRPLKTGWDERRLDYPAAGRVAIGEAFRRVRSLLEELIGQETEDAEALAARKTQAFEAIGSFDRKRQIQSAYQAPERRPESRLIDRTDA